LPPSRSGAELVCRIFVSIPPKYVPRENAGASKMPVRPNMAVAIRAAASARWSARLDSGRVKTRMQREKTLSTAGPKAVRERELPSTVPQTLKRKSPRFGSRPGIANWVTSIPKERSVPTRDVRAME